MAALTALAALLLALHLLTARITHRRLSRPAPRLPAGQMPAVTLLRPVCGVDFDLGHTLGSGFVQDAPGHEVIHCVDDPDDPAIAVLRALMKAHPAVPARLLIGRDRISGNPKLNNLAKGWAAARGDWVVMADSNLTLPPDYLRQVMACHRAGVGMISSPAVGDAAPNFWARVEAGFLNGYQARWQLTADSLGAGFAQGKTLAFPRDWLNAQGGLAALATDLAEDVAATKLVRAAGLRVRVTRQPFNQPLGPRAVGPVWRRQARWAQLRRAGFPALYLLEPLTTPVLPALLLAGTAPMLLPGFLLAWYGAEWALARRAGWPAGWRDLPAWMLRDLALLPLWLTGWRRRPPVWRDHAVTRAETPAEAAEPAA